jgi:signal transduction histidine kinase
MTKILKSIAVILDVPRTSILIFKTFTFFVTIIILFGCGNRQKSNASHSQFHEISQGWEYRWGDSPFDSNNVPLWTLEDLEYLKWNPINYSKGIINPPDRQAQEVLWLRVRLPEKNIRDPHIYVQNVRFACEVYLDKKLLYRFKSVNVPGQGKFTEDPFHLFPLDLDFPEKTLFFRIYSEDLSFIGLGKVALSAHADVTHKILIRGAISSLIFGFLFIATGLIPLFLFIFKPKEKSYFAFGLFCLSVGFWTLTNTGFWQHLLDAPRFLFYVSTPWPFLTAIGISLYFEQIFGAGYKSILRRMWQFFLGFAIMALFLLHTSLLNMTTLMGVMMVFMALLGVTMLILFATSIHAALKGNKEAKYITIGFSLFCFFAIYDILGGAFQLFSWSQNMYPLGMFFFILSLGFVLERRFQHYADELEKSNIKLQDYSQNLEQKVEERTRELKEAQAQLIMREKMASLGNLVAGVAHEINNPVGVVHSSADVMKRGIRQIKSILKSGSTLEAVNRSDQFQNTIKILEDNNNVTTIASDRIQKIVKSLRTFARLDEAEYQKADVHEGLESTLTLIHHKIKERITIIKEYGEVPQIYCYPNQLNQVFMNILMNAIQAIKKKGRIIIKSHLEDNRVKISISDNGEGISPENINKLFNPGFTTRGVGVGTGLGLSISYNIIQKHDGEIKIESEVGKGTTFTIILPVTSKTTDGSDLKSN